MGPAWIQCWVRANRSFHSLEGVALPRDSMSSQSSSAQVRPHQGEATPAPKLPVLWAWMPTFFCVSQQVNAMQCQEVKASWKTANIALKCWGLATLTVHIASQSTVHDRPILLAPSSGTMSLMQIAALTDYSYHQLKLQDSRFKVM